MRAKEFIVDHSGQKLDEFLPALAAAGGALARGAVAGAGALGRGAMAVGNTALKGAQTIGNGIEQGAQAVGDTIATGVEKIGQAAPGVVSKVTNNIKSGVDNIKGAVQQAGGGNIDSNRLSKTLANQVPGQPLNPQAQKDLQALMPGLADALMNPNTAGQIKQAISTGAKQQAQQQQKQSQQASTVGSNPNTISPA